MGGPIRLGMALPGDRGGREVPVDHLDNRASSEPHTKRHREALALADRLEEIGTFPRQVKALRCCGVSYPEVGGGTRSMSCNLRFCPVCQPRWRHRALLSWKAKVEALLGETGEAVAVTLTGPNGGGPLFHQKATLRGQLTTVFRKHAWKGAAGHIHRVGVLLVMEVGARGGDHPRPHAHLLLVAAAPGEAASVAGWLVKEWLAAVPGSNPRGQDASFCERPAGVGRWLNYILKGDVLDPSWPDDRLEASACALIDGSHRVRVLGLLHHRRRLGGRSGPRCEALAEERRLG